MRKLLPIIPDRVLSTTMGHQSTSLEGVARKRIRRGQVQDAIIGAVALSGILVIAIAAPNAARIFKNFNIASSNPAHRFRERISMLRKKGLLKWNCVHGTYTLELTRAGRDYAKRIHLRTIKISKPRKWDGMRRIVIFDIPEKKRWLRDKVRHLLQDLGLYQLQDSVWVHPYDFEEILEILQKDLKVGPEMRYVVAAAIEWDEPLREHFSLDTTS